MRAALLLLAIAGAGAVRTFRGQKAVHGTLGRDASLSLLKRRVPIGEFRCDLFVRQSTTRAVLSACIALRHKSTYCIVQIREESASMYVCRVRREGVHRIAAILSTDGATPLQSLKDAVDWHESVFPNVTLCM